MWKPPRLGAPDRSIQSIRVSQGDATPGLPHHRFPAGDVEPRSNVFSWEPPCSLKGLVHGNKYSCIPRVSCLDVYIFSVYKDHDIRLWINVLNQIVLLLLVIIRYYYHDYD